ncbi:MAG: hypothetical protein VX265_05050 [Myxococcota bacterium]|nr:hypothetical protein [Myxococcota bacterium]MEC8422540.1 hypothetical protein [Myxococcota bacterium]
MLPIMMLLGCGLSSPDGTHRDGAAPRPLPPVVSPPAEDESVVPPVPEPPAGCRYFFSERDANHAFAALSEQAADCAFEGVHVAGSTLSVHFRTDGGRDAIVALQSARCEGPGEQAGGLHLSPDDAASQSCPGSVALIRRLAGSDHLPVGTAGTYGE